MRMIAFVLFAVPLACTDGDADRVANVPASVSAPAANEQHGSANSAAATKAFQDQIAAYVALRNKVESTVPQLTETSDPNKISQRERALGEALIKARPNAKPGDYFVKEYVPVLEQTIKADFAKRTPAERKALIVELPKGMKFGVNQIYPTTIPLATFPGNLLKALPELPPELEYRIVYRHVILLDVEGNYVVDMVPNVFPIPM
jgi:hypothetical protein